MKSSLALDLEKIERLAFARVADCREFVERFHKLKSEEHTDFGLLRKIYGWMVVPLSLWPMDLKGLGLHVLGCIEEGKEVPPEARLMCELLPEAPGEAVCGPVSAYEHGVKEGNYEELIEAQHKFDLMEEELAKNTELRADWERISAQFEVDNHRNAQGVIRRRMAQERNFRPKDWKFAWETEEQRFQQVFDAFCHKWDLYGMQRCKAPNAKKHPSGKVQDSRAKQKNLTEKSEDGSVTTEDKPLLMKLTVNLTPFGTIIMVPRYWSFDPRRDLNWKAITRLHRVRCGSKQGPKLSMNQTERRAEAARAAEFWNRASAAGLRGERRTEWVMEKLGWDARTDESRLRRLLKGTKQRR